VGGHRQPPEPGDHPGAGIDERRACGSYGGHTEHRAAQRADGVGRQANRRQQHSASLLDAEHGQAQREREPRGTARPPHQPARTNHWVAGEQVPHPRDVPLGVGVGGQPHRCHQQRTHQGQGPLERDRGSAADEGDQRQRGQRGESHRQPHPGVLNGEQSGRPVLGIALIAERGEQRRVERARHGVEQSHREPGSDQHRRGQPSSDPSDRHHQRRHALSGEQPRQCGSRREPALQATSPPRSCDGRDTCGPGDQTEGPCRTGLFQHQ
jgi:hypothetical protein